jgi:hypothetical protein
LALKDAVDSIDINDGMLVERSYQMSIVDQVSAAAGQAFDDLVGQILGSLATTPQHVLVRGLPPAQATQILVSISAVLGRLLEPVQEPWSRVVRTIVPTQDRSVDGLVLNEYLHTDGTDWAKPNDYTCLFCVKPDQNNGGVSRLLLLDVLLDQLSSKSSADLLNRVVDRPLPWRIADGLGGGTHWAPAIELAPLTQIRWLRSTILLSDEDELAKLDDDLLDDLHRLEVLIEQCPATLETPLAAGDLLIINNRRCLHARTPITSPASSERELRRTKVAQAETLQ